MDRPTFESSLEGRLEKKIKLNLLTPNRVIWSEKVWEALIPSLSGPMAILWNHTTTVTILETGLCRILHEIKVEKNKDETETSDKKTNKKTNKKTKTEEEDYEIKIVWTPIVVDGGLAEIDQNHVAIVATEVEEIFEVDIKETQERLKAAIKEFENMGIIDEENSAHLEKLRELKRARAVLQAKRFLDNGKDNNQANMSEMIQA